MRSKPISRRRAGRISVLALSLFGLPIGSVAWGAVDEALVSDTQLAAEWISRALNQSGYRADFSVDSLREVERFFAEHSSSGRANPGGLLSERTGPRLFAIGAYVGEVIRRAGGGQWYAEAGDPDGELNIEVQLPDGSRIWPMHRVIKRLKNGPEENIHHYGVFVLGTQGSAEEPGQ